MAKESAFPPFNLSADGVPLCWGCAPDHRCKLGVQRIDVDTINAIAVAVARCPTDWQGGPGVAHGGWVTCVFDEVLGRLPSALDVPCVTAKLEVSFRSVGGHRRRVLREQLAERSKTNYTTNDRYPGRTR
jgi:hypothetical protein